MNVGVGMINITYDIWKEACNLVKDYAKNMANFIFNYIRFINLII